MSNIAEQARRAEEDLNSYQAKQGIGRKSDSATESGVDEMAGRRFNQDSEVRTGSEAGASGSDNRVIPPSEGGDYDDRGRVTKAKHFEGPGGPEDKARIATEQRAGDDDTLTPRELKMKGI